MMPQTRKFGQVALLLATLGLAVATLLSHMPTAFAKDQILTKRTVELFLTSYPDVKAIAERHAKQKGKQIAGATDQLAAVMRVVSDETIVGEVDTAVQAHGFSGSRQWLSVASAVARAYAHIRSGINVSKANRKLKKAIAKIEKNDFLNDKQKAKLIKGLLEGAGEFLEEPPKENIATVKPMTDKIAAVIFQ